MSDFLPIEFENRMRKMLGDEYEAFETALSGERYRGLRVSPLKVNSDGRSAAEIFREKSSPEGEEETFCKDLEPVTWAENGYYYDEALQPGKHPYHEAGVYYIQEPSAMLPGTLLEAKTGERVLDLCSAPGGKSTQIASYMDGKGLLVSNEINGQRARILSENIERMGIKNAVVTSESPASLSDRFEGFFDRIMVDAPCSGEGMFRKNEEAIKEWSPENVKMCAERQAEILDCAAKMLKAGGRIVYSTCTFAPEEDEESIENFLKRHGDFKVLDMHRLWPHKIKGEGHFAAVLEKTGENVITDGESNISDTPLSKTDLKKIKEYLSDVVKEDLFEEGGFLGSGRLENFGDSVYLVPSSMPTLRGLKVLRPGLCLGSIKKDRFEPAHSLALAINSSMALRNVDLNIKEAGDYIKGLTVNTDVEKGWALVSVNGYSLAWGKSAGGILKNHYPKGLRK